MNIPHTPKTLISQIFHPDKGYQMNLSWNRFFEIYHPVIESFVRVSLLKRNWQNIDSNLIEEITSDVLINLVKFDDGYDRSKHFRGLLKQVVDRRVIDYIRKENRPVNKQKNSLDKSIDAEGEFVGQLSDIVADRLVKEEAELTLNSNLVVLNMMLENLRDFLAPKTIQIFTRIKLEGEDKKMVMEDLNITSGAADNAVYRCMNKLKELSQNKEYRKEYYTDEKY